MNYEKITLKDFARRLGANMYKTLTAARRAIGKADWPEATRQKAHILADDHFGRAKLARQLGEAPRVAPQKPPTHEEFVALAGKANETVEQIRLSAALSPNLRPALAQGTELLLACLEQTARRLGVTLRR